MSTKHRTLPALEEDYQVLSDTVREFADEVVAPVSAELDAQHEFPYEIVAQMGEMGLFGLPFPEEYGGMGGDYFALALALEQLGRRPHEHVGRLERLDPADEEQHDGVVGEPEPGPGRALLPRHEEVEVDAWGHDDHPVGVGVVVADELARLALGVGDEPVGDLDDLGLADLPARGLGDVVGGQLAVLDPGHRVHRVDEGHLPALGDEPADLAGEPVVRVRDVVVPRGDAGDLAHHPGSEGAQLPRQVLLDQALVGAGVDVPHRHPGHHLDDVGQVGGRAPGEDLDLDAPRTQPLRGLHHVHVEPARVARTGLVERRGVDADHRHPLHRASAGLGHAAQSLTRESRPVAVSIAALAPRGSHPVDHRLSELVSRLSGWPLHVRWARSRAAPRTPIACAGATGGWWPPSDIA